MWLTAFACWNTTEFSTGSSACSRIRLEPGSAKAVPKPLVAKARGCRLDLQKRDAKEVFEALTERRKKEVYGLGLG